MMKKILPYLRQIHLDFHTSEHIPDIGIRFSEAQFIEALQIARVNSINFFAMGHHGWCYYPTATGMNHPHLKTDLVGGMMRACRKAGINPVVYVTVGWNDKASREHPEWCIRKPDGSLDGPPQAHAHSARDRGWYRICCNTPYLEEVVLPVTREVMKMYDPAGIWFDITGEFVCTCDWCRAGMREAGLDHRASKDRQRWAKTVYLNYLKKTTEIVWGKNPDATVYHNGTDKKGRHDLYPYWSHYEIESLPTGGWGYNHFPVNARYFTMLPDTSVVSMTGKFHQFWGEFGGFKSALALRYEAAQIMSLGCAACVGDQLHPNGEMDLETYRIIGEAYRDIEEREEWLTMTKPVAEVAVLSPSGVTKIETREDKSESGACRMLMECHVPHVVIDEQMDFSPYRILVLPDAVPVDEKLKTKLEVFLENDGKLILSHQSGLNPECTFFALDIGAEYNGPSPWDVEYIKVGDEIAENLVRSPFLAYRSGVVVKVKNAAVLAETWQPYFNRTFAHFCSHRNTPPEKKAGWPAVVRQGSVIYISQPLFRIYNEQGMQLHRDLFANCLKLLQEKPIVKIELPSCGRMSVMHQKDHNRYIIHLLYANPIKRGAVEVIEDVVPLYDVPVALRVGGAPQAVYSAPSKEAIPFQYDEGYVSFAVRKLLMHEMVVVEMGPA